MDKLRKIKNRLLTPEDRRNTPDLYTFQETKLCVEYEKSCNAVLPGKVLYSPGSGGSKGVLLGIHPSSSLTFLNSIQDAQGQYIVAECGYETEIFTVVSVYLEPLMDPADYEKILKDIAKIVDGFGHSRVVFMGDFNVPLNKQLDSTTITDRNAHKRKILKSFLETHALTDVWRTVNPLALRYTVCTKTKIGAVLSRLDYFFASPALVTGIEDTSIDLSYCSDHNPITLDVILTNRNSGRGYWKFPDFLVKDINYRKELGECISNAVRNNPNTEPGLLWDVIKAAIRGFTIEYLGRKKKERKEQIEAVEVNIFRANELRDAFATDPYKVAFYNDQMIALQADLDKLYERLNESAFKFKAAQHFYESNRCTKFYFRQNAPKKDAIKCLQTHTGKTVTSQAEILTECRDYYQNVYQQLPMVTNEKIKEKFLSRIDKNSLTSEGYDLLGKPITKSELHEALMRMRKDAVPGEDGLTVHFYLAFWEEIKDLFFDSIIFAYDAGHMSITQRRGLIRLIHKPNKNPLLTSSYRPITLLNVDYKAVTKLFAMRLSLFLPDLIHTDQRGFIKHRTIHENLLDVQAILDSCENMNEEGMLILLDIQKAFDSIGWNFLRSVLIQYGFPQYFIHWFEIFYTGKELHVLNDGHISEVIFPSKGVAQGCGISPLYFILGLEVLALAIRQDNRIVGMSTLGVTKKLNLLADDGLLALKWAQSSFDAVVSILKEFGEISNLQINKCKSVIVRIGVNLHDRIPLEGTESFLKSVDGSFRYLGVDWHRHCNKLSMQGNFDEVLENIYSAARKQDTIKHYLIGRILNVKALFVSKLTYKLQTIPAPPVKWFHTLQSFLNNYIWSNSVHHVHAQQMYRSVEEGGLNMINIAMFEKSLKMVWVCKALQQPETFWVAQLQSCLKVPLNTFLVANLKSCHIGRLCNKSLPPVWECILKYWCDYHYTDNGGNVALMPLAYNSTLCNNARSCLFNEDKLERYVDFGVHTVKDFIEEYEGWTRKEKIFLGARPVMNRIPGEWVTQVDSDNYGEIPKLETLLHSGFTVNVCYQTLLQSQHKQPIKAIAKWERDLGPMDLEQQWPRICNIQKSLVGVRLQTFYFKYIHRGIRLNRIAAYYTNQSPLCTFCKVYEETFTHLFWDCPTLKHLRIELIQWCKVKVCSETDYSNKNCLIVGFEKPVLNIVFTLYKYHIHLLRILGGDRTFDALLGRIIKYKAAMFNAYHMLPSLKVGTARKLWSPLGKN